MDRRVTPPKRVTSPTYGPPPPLHVNRPLEFIYVFREILSTTMHVFLLLDLR